MDKFIWLTRDADYPVAFLIPLSELKYVVYSGEGSEIWYNSEEFYRVREQPGEIAELIRAAGGHVAGGSK